MSTTSIYALGSNPRELESFSNGYRGAMFVWNQIAVKYFDLEHFPAFWHRNSKEMQSKIWNAHNHAELIDDEIIVLASTMDFATVSKAGIERLIEAFQSYGKRHPASSFTEQAEFLSSYEFNDSDVLAWQQTSCGEFWGDDGFDEESEEYIYYDVEAEDKHFDVIEMFNNLDKAS